MLFRSEGLETLRYSTDRIAVVMPAEHVLARVPKMSFNDVLEEEIVALEAGSSMMRLLAQQAVIAGGTLHLRVEVRSFDAVCRMVQVGFGLGLLPYQAASVLGQGLGLAVRPLTEEWAEREMLICVNKERMSNTSVAKLLTYLEATRDA